MERQKRMTAAELEPAFFANSDEFILITDTGSFKMTSAIFFSDNGKDEKFKELKYGDWEGAFIPQLKQSFPEMFHHLRVRPELYDPTEIGGETYLELVKRGTAVVETACAAFPGKDLLFVGHSITITCTMLSLLKKETKDLRSSPPLENTSISILNLTDGHYSLEKWNGIDHLA